MMGTKERSFAPLINVSLEEIVPQDDLYRGFFEQNCEKCKEAGILWVKDLYIDSTQVNANADLDSLTPRFAVEAREAIHEHLSALFPPDPPSLEQLESSSSQTPLPEP